MNINKGPEIIMVGMSRAGTSFMYHNLQKHPQIYVPTRKEICYFAHKYFKGVKWYNNFFNKKKKGEIAIDICGVYFTNIKSVTRIKKYNPNVKIILCLRNPYEWVYSFYEQYSSNYTMPSFKQFLNGCTIKREGDNINLDFTKNIITKTIKAFKTEFHGNIMIYDFSYFTKEPLKILSEIEKFIGVDAWYKDNNFTNEKINASGRKRPIWFDKLLQVKGVVNLILKIFPRTFILKLRYIWEKKSAKNIDLNTINNNYSEADHHLAQKTFKNDYQYIKELFHDNRIIY